LFPPPFDKSPPPPPRPRARKLPLRLIDNGPRFYNKGIRSFSCFSPPLGFKELPGTGAGGFVLFRVFVWGGGVVLVGVCGF